MFYIVTQDDGVILATSDYHLAVREADDAAAPDHPVLVHQLDGHVVHKSQAAPSPALPDHSQLGG